MSVICPYNEGQWDLMMFKKKPDVYKKEFE